jgi:hypothetical protein
VVEQDQDLVAEFLCVEEFGAHDWQPTSDWIQPVHDGAPSAIGEYRDVKCSRCPAVGVEAQAPAEGVAEQVAARYEAQQEA